MQLVTIIAAMLITVLPPVSPSRPKTARLSRGPVWTSFKTLALDKARVDATKAELGQLSRVAAASSSKPDSSRIFALLCSQKLRYGKELLAVDFVTSVKLFEDCSSLEQAVEVANAAQLNQLVWCEQQGRTIVITVVELSNVTKATKVELEIADSWLSRASDALIEVLKALNVELSDEQLRQTPSVSEAALGKWLEAYTRAASIVNAKDEASQKTFCRQAAALCDEALVLDPRLIEAYVLKASCLDELGEEGGVKQTLRDGFSRRDSSKIDLLTNLELEADYARFFKMDTDAAFAGYERMVESDPDSLVGTWGLIDILLTGDGVSRPVKEDVAEAGRLATLILAAHPQSAVAKVISNQVVEK